MSQENYFGRKVARTGAAEVLAIFDRNSVAPKVGVKRGLILVRSPGQTADLGWCSSGWTRTNNPAINSRMLCQLSYGGPCSRGDKLRRQEEP